MAKWIEVTITASKLCLVEVEESDDDPEATALNIAMVNDMFGCADEGSAGKTLTDIEAISTAIRHADRIYPL